MTPTPHEIHTVTYVPHHDPEDPKAGFFAPRCLGYYLTREEARLGMGNCDDECGYYTHCVIERYTPGIWAMADQAEWFLFDQATHKWVATPPPDFSDKVVNYAIG